MALVKKYFEQVVRRMFGKRTQLSKPVVRLFVAQGPSQLLMCDTVAQYLNANSGGRATENICILFGKYAFSEDCGISLATRIVSKSATWDRVVDLFDFEDALWQNLDADFPEILKEIRLRCGVEKPDELYLKGNWQITNELICAAFSEAEIGVFGDGLGNIDSVRLPTFGIPKAVYAVLPDYHILMDSECCVTPENTPLNVIPKEFYRSAIELAAANVDFHSAPDLGVEDMGTSALVLTSTYVEAQYLGFEDEVQLVVDLIIPRLKGIDRVYVKPHPRETAGQAAEVVRRLNRQSLPCQAILFRQDDDSGIRYLPLEMLLSQYKFKAILTPVGSYASILIPWLFGIDVDLPSIEEIFAALKKEPEEVPMFHACLGELWGYKQKVQTWDGKSVLWTRQAKHPEAYGHLKMTDREKRWRAELEYTSQSVRAVRNQTETAT